MVKVDAYLVEAVHAHAYIAQREQAAARAMQAMRGFYHRVDRCRAGSQDGEAVVGINAKGEIVAMIHLDPQGVERIHSLPDDALAEMLRQP